MRGDERWHPRSQHPDDEAERRADDERERQEHELDDAERFTPAPRRRTRTELREFPDGSYSIEAADPNERKIIDADPGDQPDDEGWE